MKNFISRLWAEIFSKETLNYFIVGVVNTLLGWVLTFLFNSVFHAGYWVTSICVFLFGMVFSFIANRKFTFKSDTPVKEVLPKYLLEVGICFLLAYGLGKLLFDWFFSSVLVLPFEDSLMDSVKGICANILYIGFNFIGQKFFVFKKETPADEA